MPRKKNEYGWKEFVKFAEQEGINLEHEDDWGPWWNCWKGGYIAAELVELEHARLR
jgi:hypothetical protein